MCQTALKFFSHMPVTCASACPRDSLSCWKSQLVLCQSLPQGLRHVHFSLKPRMDLLIVLQIRHAQPLQLQNPACNAVRSCLAHSLSREGLHGHLPPYSPWLLQFTGQCSCNFETILKCHCHVEFQSAL